MRSISDFLTSYLEYTQDQESPESFHFWSGVTTIAACLGQRTWIDRAQYKIYPNVFTVLVSDSGICRKSTAVKIAENLLLGMGEQGPNLLPQRATPEALVKLLKKLTVNDATLKHPVTGGVMIVPELDTMFSGDERRKRQMLTLLTDLYDVPKKHDTATIVRKQEVLYYPCLSLLGASTRDWLKDIVGERGVGGGFASRVYFIHAEKTDRFIPNPARDKKLRDDLIQDLLRLDQYRGAWRLNDSTDSWFLAYYKECHTYAQICEKAMRGYASRKCDHMMRLALILAVSEGVDKQIISQDHMERAANCVGQFELSLESIYDDLQTTGDGKLRGDVYEYIRRKGEVQRQEIVKRFHRRANAKQLDEFLTTLEQAELIERHIGNRSMQMFKLKGV